MKKISDLDRNKYTKALEILLTQKLLHEEEFEIGFGAHNEKKYSILSFNQYDDEKELNLKLDIEENFILEFSYWDEEGIQIINTLTLLMEELVFIPKGLQNIMADCLKNEKSTTFKNGSLGPVGN